MQNKATYETCSSTTVLKFLSHSASDDDTRWRRRPLTSFCRPLRPCMGGNPRPGYDLRPTPFRFLACCHWLPWFKVSLHFQAYDLCHASFLRPLTAISWAAFSISGFVLSSVLRGCILRVHNKVFVIFVSLVWFAIMQGLQGRANDVSGRRRHRVSSSRGAWLYFGVVFVFVGIIYGFFFGAPFSTFQWVVSFVCCKKHVLPLACIFSTDF